MTNIVVFASGGGSNFQSIINAINDGLLSAKITGLITNKSGIKSLERAKENNIPTSILSVTNFESTLEYEQALLQALESYAADIIVLAGYLRKIPSSVIDRYEGKILNIHPSLLPKYGGKGFYGMKVHSAVIENGESTSGCTVHLVTEIYDDGPILGQQVVPVLEDDTPEILAERVLKEEHILYPKVIKDFIQQL